MSCHWFRLVVCLYTIVKYCLTNKLSDAQETPQKQKECQRFDFLESYVVSNWLLKVILNINFHSVEFIDRIIHETSDIFFYFLCRITSVLTLNVWQFCFS